MGKLEQKSDGNYLLEVRIGNLQVEKGFRDVDKPLDEISKVPMPDGFYLHIPDIIDGINAENDKEKSESEDTLLTVK